MDGELGFESLDFVYTPSRDVAADVADFTTVLGGRLVFAIEDGGVRVAMIDLPSGPPHILLTDHVEGERPILVYGWRTCRSPWPHSRVTAGRRSVRWRSRRDRAAPSARMAATGSPSTNWSGHRSWPVSRAGAISELGRGNGFAHLGCTVVGCSDPTSHAGPHG